MEILYSIVVAPFVDMWTSPVFFSEVVISGLLTGVMYSLVALGFVLIFKASGVFNFAQGAMVLFAALTLVGLMENGVPVWLALILTMLVMVALAIAIERLMLRPLVNQEHIILFMATIGLTFFLEGLGELMWGSNVKMLDVGIPSESFEVGGILLNEFDLYAAAIGAALVTVLAVFFHKTSVGRALRAVADDHQAALSVGIPLKTIWIIVWSVAGIVAMVAGIMWGAKSGVQFSFSNMATIGLTFFLEGLGELMWGSNVKMLDVGIPSESFEVGGILLNEFDLYAAAIGAALVTVLAVFFHKTSVGRALRAVADDHQAALSVGIPLKTIWIIVWSVAGIVAMVAGIMWGAKSGVQFSLSLIALKALPVLILGGFTSVPGAIVGGLIIGVGEKVAEIYWGPLVGGAIENWFAYMLALAFLLFRPQGLFGERIIERV